jgi:hypothetical protein
VAYHLGGKDSRLAQMIYHDLAGWLMMPMALALLWLELKFLANLFVAEPEAAPLPLMMAKPQALALKLPKKATTT